MGGVKEKVGEVVDVAKKIAGVVDHIAGAVPGGYVALLTRDLASTATDEQLIAAYGVAAVAAVAGGALGVTGATKKLFRGAGGVLEESGTKAADLIRKI